MNTVQRVIAWIDTANDLIGRVVSSLALFMVLVQFCVVVLRYVFGLSFIWMQESVVYLHATLFMLGAAYTLLHEGHVRVDIFYRTAPLKTKALVDAVGALVFLLPVCGLILWASVPYVSASWSILEGSPETSGIQAVYLLKSAIIGFAGLMAMQGLSMILRSVLTLLNTPTPKFIKDGKRS
ncbi:MAG: C4-dicarboxylate ABC transporter permease [Rhodospirillaceae bacterium]|nr:MAG: C4-dicarboxylate ABC transporter permease [Rhodospirillaceae bacterium]